MRFASGGVRRQDACDRTRSGMPDLIGVSSLYHQKYRHAFCDNKQMILPTSKNELRRSKRSQVLPAGARARAVDLLRREPVEDGVDEAEARHLLVAPRRLRAVAVAPELPRRGLRVGLGCNLGPIATSQHVSAASYQIAEQMPVAVFPRATIGRARTCAAGLSGQSGAPDALGEKGVRILRPAQTMQVGPRTPVRTQL